MKPFLLLILLIDVAYAQTFRNGFDVYESPYSQGYSFHSNVQGELNWAESPYLTSYLTMFKTTKDKRYLDKFQKQQS